MSRAAALVTALLLLPTVASAQEPFGRFAVEGRFSNGRATTAEVTVRTAPGGAIEVVRVGRVAGGAPFTWKASDARRASGRTLRATFRLEPTGGAAGAIAHLGPSSTDAAAIAALSATNVLEAVYFLSSDGQSVREVIVNTTRLGAESRWRHLTTNGRRVTSTSTGPLSAAELRARVERDVKAWYERYTRDVYADLLAGATTAAERARLTAQRAEDLDFATVCEVTEGDDAWEEDIHEAYANDDPYRTAAGDVVPRSAVKVYVLSMMPAHAGIGLSKVFVLDGRTGATLHEGDVTD
jgi:hypothetical protein